ncbi:MULTISPECIES: dephospho-CoA kinase [unclassified Actinomyces]|uniref:dephospho-CoA kinase n=1 Tax=unclassified Actinomyces TaxID=2609248 RepID=UPI0013742F23|nr:dephospho-CoA kinase [Actinomyces sp. 432]NDR54060.1 dephospho-CoA kinase [Actinomyces sp. 565]QHO92194.1 dephospho-CoA kinase [Actinomyces sp. 432]
MGLTGGIGAGKSEVARLLSAHGARVVSADAISREVVEPGTEGLAAVVAEFGQQLLTADGALDRRALGRLVFADPLRRARLEEIILPLVAAEAWSRLAAVPAGQVAVYDVPLLVEGQMEGMFDVVVVVETELETRLERLGRRGLEREQALARIAAQATDAERRAVADVVVPNSGSLEELAAAVKELWDNRLAPAAD